MSLKWQRSKKWDDENFPAWAWPAKAVLRAFSSIPLAVCLLTFVVLYATLASVPIGLLVLAVTYVFYGATLVCAIGVVGVLPSVIVWRVSRRMDWGLRFAQTMFCLIVMSALGVWLWQAFAWPALRYDPSTHQGVRFFASFVERYGSTTLRRLPGVEMTELEFYAAWPLRVVLLAFVLNMIVATVRRIEFVFPNIGVLTVHTGIVVMALGSIYYAGLKQEGMALLRAGTPATPTSLPGEGPPTTHFYDNIEVSLYLDQGSGWEQRVLRGVPRYNDYNVRAGAERTLSSMLNAGAPEVRSLGPLSIEAPGSDSGLIDPSLSFEIVGYAGYAEPMTDWVEAPATGPDVNPIRVVDIYAPDVHQQGADRPAFSFSLRPRDPAGRATSNGVLDIDYRMGMTDDEWRDVTARVAPGTRHAVIVEVPEDDFRAVYPIEQGQTVTIGETGYTVHAEEFMAQPPFPIITPGYEGATSAVALLTITKPDGTSVQRWAYHRFPEISQDFVPSTSGGRPARKPADPAIRTMYLDDTHPQIYVDEREDGTMRAAVREPRSGVRVFDHLEPDGRIPDIFQRTNPEAEPQIDMAFGERWANAEQVTLARVVPERQRDPQFVGTHDMAMVAVRASNGQGWSETVWVQATSFPLARFGPEHEALVHPPGGRAVRIMFGARQRPLPGFAVELEDFQMIAYAHRGAPRDYQSTVRVIPTRGDSFEAYTHVARLNAPLQAPFMWDDDRPLLTNVMSKLVSRLNPNQFKLSQARWDAGGWEQTQEAADRGEIERPYARWTILGVGNNPGIHVIALGGVLIAVGTPWAFYVKPMIMRARKRRIQASLARGTTVPALVPAEPMGAES